MRTTRRAFLGQSAAAAAGLAGLAAAGCGDDDDDKGAAKATGTATSGGGDGKPVTAAATTVVAYKQGGTIRSNLPSDPPHQDFHRSNNAYLLQSTVAYAYSQLVTQRATQGSDKLVVAPDLALSWEQPDKTTYVFKLRTDANFHEIAPVNGRKVVAGDIVYSFNRQIAEKITGASLGGIKSMTAIDDATLRIETDAPNVDFLTSLAYAANKVLAREAVEKSGNIENGPTIGSGPYILEKFDKGNVTLVRNPKYFIPGRPVADKLDLVTMRDSAAIEAQFRTGNFTYASTLSGGLTPASAIAFQKDGYPAVQRKDQPTQWVMVNTQRPAFKDPRIRQALSKAIDRDLVIANALEGQAGLNICSMFLPEPEWLLPEAEMKKALAQDLKEARALLSAAGGIPAGEEFQSSSSDVVVAQSQLIQQNFKDAGWDAKIRVIDAAELTAAFQASNSKVTILSTAVSHQGTTFTSDSEAYYKTGGAANSFRVSDPTLDGLIDKQKAEFDSNARKVLILDFQRKFLEVMPSLPVASRWTIWVAQKSVKNLIPFTVSYSYVADIAPNG